MIIDCHVHIPSTGETWEWAPFTPDLDACVRYLKKCGVERAVATSVRAVTAKTPGDVKRGNDEVFEAAEKYDGFFIPATIANPECAGALEELERCREKGSVWLGEICGYAAGFKYMTREFEALVAKAVELNMVVQFHATGEEMKSFCEKFPEGTFVLPHPVSHKDQIAERVEIMKELPNLHLDLCGRGYERMGVMEMAAKIDRKRVLFGSDYTINDPSAVIARVRGSYLSDEEKSLILGGNTTRLLRERGARDV